jgi:hypothetical protein
MMPDKFYQLLLMQKSWPNGESTQKDTKHMLASGNILLSLECLQTQLYGSISEDYDCG